jgi:protein-glucosylgalactosylhydroxylysine glucosidase
MTVSRRHFLGLAIAGAAFSNTRAADAAQRSARSNFSTAINRKALVTRHNPVLQKFDTLSPLSIGNGEFAFTADATGLQTFGWEYEKATPLCTMAQWGWHTTPIPNGLDPNGLRLTQYDTHGRSVGYHTSSEGQTELFNWLRQNPHRLNLGRIGLNLSKGDLGGALSDISEINQKLDLWTGILESNFRFDGQPIRVRTAVHPAYDLLAVEINSPLVQNKNLAMESPCALLSPTGRQR